MCVWPSLSSAFFNKAEVVEDDAYQTDPKGGFDTLKAECRLRFLGNTRNSPTGKCVV